MADPFQHTGARTVLSIAALKALPVTGLTVSSTVEVLGYYAEGDGGGGIFRYDPLATAADNGGTVIAPTSGSGRWLRDLNSNQINVLWFGAKRDDTGNQAAAVNAAITAAAVGGAGGSVYIPKGTYRFTSPIVPANYVMLFGEYFGTVLHWARSGNFLTMQDKLGCSFRDLIVHGDQTHFALVLLFNSFVNTFTNVGFRGTNDVESTVYEGQIGVYIDQNSGDNFFNSCRWMRLGVPVKLHWAVGNFINQSHFSGCYYGIVGEPNVTASMVVTNTSFASYSGIAPNPSPAHIDIRGQAGEWHINNCWFEGANKSIIVGRGGGLGGPSAFSLTNSHLASNTTNLEIQGCRQPYIANCVFSNNPPANPTHISIDPAGADTGTALNLVPHTGVTEIPLSVFPPGWLVFSRYSYQLPT
jgi:hypothetical protein